MTFPLLDLKVDLLCAQTDCESGNKRSLNGVKINTVENFRADVAKTAVEFITQFLEQFHPPCDAWKEYIAHIASENNWGNTTDRKLGKITDVNEDLKDMMSEFIQPEDIIQRVDAGDITETERSILVKIARTMADITYKEQGTQTDEPLLYSLEVRVGIEQEMGLDRHLTDRSYNSGEYAFFNNYEYPRTTWHIDNLGANYVCEDDNCEQIQKNNTKLSGVAALCFDNKSLTPCGTVMLQGVPRIKMNNLKVIDDALKEAATALLDNKELCDSYIQKCTFTLGKDKHWFINYHTLNVIAERGLREVIHNITAMKLNQYGSPEELSIQGIDVHRLDPGQVGFGAHAIFHASPSLRDDRKRMFFRGFFNYNKQLVDDIVANTTKKIEISKKHSGIVARDILDKVKIGERDTSINIHVHYSNVS